jgi:hypothetical protein
MDVKIPQTDGVTFRLLMSFEVPAESHKPVFASSQTPCQWYYLLVLLNA